MQWWLAKTVVLINLDKFLAELCHSFGLLHGKPKQRNRLSPVFQLVPNKGIPSNSTIDKSINIFTHAESIYLTISPVTPLIGNFHCWSMVSPYPLSLCSANPDHLRGIYRRSLKCWRLQPLLLLISIPLYCHLTTLIKDLITLYYPSTYVTLVEGLYWGIAYWLHQKENTQAKLLGCLHTFKTKN